MRGPDAGRLAAHTAALAVERLGGLLQGVRRGLACRPTGPAGTAVPHVGRIFPADALRRRTSGPRRAGTAAGSAGAACSASAPRPRDRPASLDHPLQPAQGQDRRSGPGRLRSCRRRWRTRADRPRASVSWLRSGWCRSVRLGRLSRMKASWNRRQLRFSGTSTPVTPTAAPISFLRTLRA